MKLDEYIDDFIRKEKQEQVNPFLATRVMAKLEETREPEVLRKPVPIWKKLVVTASLALIVATGFGLGSIATGEKDYISININDAQLENLNLYTTADYE